MTCGRGIIGIFRQNRHFSKVLVVWRARIQTLVVWGAIRKTGGSLWAKLYIFFFLI
jgi:hypothetical protein